LFKATAPYVATFSAIVTRVSPRLGSLAEVGMNAAAYFCAEGTDVMTTGIGWRCYNPTMWAAGNEWGERELPVFLRP